VAVGRIKPKVLELNNLFQEDHGSMFFKLQAMFHELLHELFLEEEERSKQTSGSLVELSIAYMQQYYMQSITRQQLADRFSVSTGYFSRLFRKETGQSFSEYLSALRIDKAKELLLKSSASLHQIAACVGYRDEFYLSRKFKQVVGVAPTIYLKKPKKLISLAPNYTASMLALDVQPYMASMTPWIAQQFQLAFHVRDGSRIDWYNVDRDERLREAKPDIIICYEENEEEIAGIKRIAPTVPISWRRTSWREQFLQIADLVDKLPKAEAWLSRYDERVEGRKQQMRGTIERGETVTIIGVGPRNLYVFGNQWGRGGHVIYDSLGLAAPDQVKKSLHSGEGCKAISVEELPQYAGDHLFVTAFRTAGRPLVCNKRLMDSAVWKGLDAVKNNRAYEVDAGAFYGFDPVSTDAQLDIVVNRLLSVSRVIS